MPISSLDDELDSFKYKVALHQQGHAMKFLLWVSDQGYCRFIQDGTNYWKKEAEKRLTTTQLYEKFLHKDD